MSRRDWSLLIDRRFSMLIVTSILESTDTKHRRAACRCDCGSQGFVAQIYHLESGKIWCCGCKKNHVKDITGQRYGRLLVLRLARERKNGGSVWWCRCDCGVEKEIRSGSLRKKNGDKTVSCGCFQKEASSACHTTHGLSQTSDVYWTWVQMRYRCSSPSSDSYPSYGGRGIRVDPRWENFEIFMADMGPKPGPDYTLERVNNNGNYGPDNVIWATPKTQSRNKRTNRLLTYEGRTMCLADWAAEKNMSPITLWGRLAANKSIAEALEKPVAKKRTMKPRSAE